MFPLSLDNGVGADPLDGHAGVSSAWPERPPRAPQQQGAAKEPTLQAASGEEYRSLRAPDRGQIWALLPLKSDTPAGSGLEYNGSVRTKACRNRVRTCVEGRTGCPQPPVTWRMPCSQNSPLAP